MAVLAPFFHGGSQQILRKPCAGTVRVQGFAKIVQNGLTQAAGVGRFLSFEGMCFGEKPLGQKSYNSHGLIF